MTGQMHMDFDAARARADEGIRAAWEGSPEEWRDLARQTIEDLAYRQPEVVSDDVWTAGLPAPPNSATALGAAFRWAARNNLIAKTDRVRQTAQVRSHGSPMTIWRSLVFNQAPGTAEG